MPILILVLAVAFIGFGAISLGDAGTNTTFMNSQMDAINSEIVIPLGLPAAALKALFAQASLETANFTSAAYLATNSMFNRHKGNGIEGQANTDGFWTGTTYYANPGDADLRVYTDIYQSAQDMAQLLQNALYASALAALKNGDVAGYFGAVAAAGFSTQASYASAIQNVYNSLA